MHEQGGETGHAGKKMPLLTRLAGGIHAWKGDRVEMKEEIGAASGEVVGWMTDDTPPTTKSPQSTTPQNATPRAGDKTPQGLTPRSEPGKTDPKGGKGEKTRNRSVADKMAGLHVTEKKTPPGV